MKYELHRRGHAIIPEGWLLVQSNWFVKEDYYWGDPVSGTYVPVSPSQVGKRVREFGAPSGFIRRIK